MNIKYFIILASLFICNLALGAALGRSGQRLAPSARRAFMQQKRAFYTAPKIDIYAAFEIPEEDYSKQDLAKIYKTLAKLYHPDLAPKELNKPVTERFQEISNAYEQIKANEDLSEQDILQEESPKWKELKRKLEENYAYFLAHKKKKERAQSAPKSALAPPKFDPNFKPELREKLENAIRQNNVEQVNNLIKANPDAINMLLNQLDATPLLFASAILDDKMEMTEALLKHGANPNELDRLGRNALYYAVDREEPLPGVVKLLLKYGAKPTFGKGVKPALNFIVYLAATEETADRELLEILKLLLQAGADLNAKDTFVFRYLDQEQSWVNTKPKKLTAIEQAKEWLDIFPNKLGRKRAPQLRLLNQVIDIIEQEAARRENIQAIGEPTLSISERIQAAVKDILGRK